MTEGPGAIGLLCDAEFETATTVSTAFTGTISPSCWDRRAVPHRAEPDAQSSSVDVPRPGSLGTATLSVARIPIIRIGVLWSPSVERRAQIPTV